MHRIVFLALRGVLALHCVIFSTFVWHCVVFSSLASVVFSAWFWVAWCCTLSVILALHRSLSVAFLCCVVSPRPLQPHYTPIGRVSGQQLLLGPSWVGRLATAAITLHTCTTGLLDFVVSGAVCSGLLVVAFPLLTLLLYVWQLGCWCSRVCW